MSNKSIKTIIQQKYSLLKNDRTLLVVFGLHLLLIICHVSHGLMSDIQYHSLLRACGCFLISLLIFLFGRKGLSYGFTIYACALIYVNTFYNYGSIFLILVAIGANPKFQKNILIVYFINAAISFSLQRLLIFSGVIHAIYLVLFYYCISYVFKVNPPTKLNLAEDEQMILNEMLAGKKQKEIDLYSQQTITAKLKTMRERNMSDSTSTLLARYAVEKENGLKINSNSDSSND